jgi:hypothetical protein
MAVDLNTLYMYSLSQPGKDEGRPIHLVDGKPVLVMEPLGTLPGCWTRFRAALVDVPLLGRLEAVQAAARQMAAARPALEALRGAAAFRKDFHERLHVLFGPRIAEQAIRIGEQAIRSRQRRGGQWQPGLAPNYSGVLTATKITGIVFKARALASAQARQNDTYVSRFSGFSDDHERSLAVIFVRAALESRYFRESLSQGEIVRAVEPLRILLGELREAGIDPASIVGPYIENYEKNIDNTLPENGPNKAASYRDSFQTIADSALNRRKVECLRPTPSARQAAPCGRGAEPQDRDEVGTAEVDIVLALCASFDPKPDDPRPRFSDTVVRRAWKDLQEVCSELSEQLPAPRDERVAEALIRAARGRVAGTTPAGRPKLRRDQLFQLMRTALIAGELAREFDASHGESKLRRTVAEAHPWRLLRRFTLLAERLKEDMLQSIERLAPALHKQFGCAQDVQAVVKAAREQLIEHTVKATTDHLEAEDLLERSTSLLETQKDLFLAYALPEGKATPQRLDPVLVEQCERVANAIAGALPRIQAAIADDSPAALFDEMKEIAHAWTCAMTQIRKNAETMWMLLGHSQLEREEELLRLCAKLALARLRHDGQPIDGTLLAGPGSSTGSDGNTSRSSAADHPVNQFLEACEQSPWRSVSTKIAALYGDPLLPICGGQPITPRGTLTRQSEHTPLHKIRPELLVRTLIQPFEELRDDAGDIDPQDVDPRNIDHRGVLLTAPNAHRIRKDFTLPWQPGATRRWQWRRRRYGRMLRESPPPAAGSLKALEELREHVNKLATSSRILVEGRRPAGPLLRSRFAQAIETFQSLFSEPPDGPALASAISAYMQEAVLSNFRQDVNAAAFDASLFAAISPDVHELWRESDGSWRIRSSCAAHPQSLGGEPLNTDGVILYTLEHRVTPDGRGGAPRIELIDAKAVFAF